MTTSLDIKTASGKKSKKEKPNRLTVDSPEVKIAVDGKRASKKKLVDVMIGINQEIENKKGELAAHKSTLIDHVTGKRKESHEAKSFVKTIDVQGTHAKMQVQFQDRYTPLSADMEQPLKDIFESNFSSMFTVNETEVLKPEKKEALKSLLGEKYETFFEKTKTVSPVKDFQYHYFLVQDSLNENQKETIQKVFDACQSTPAVKYPK